MSIEVPVEYGGLGYSFAHTIAAIKEISKVDPGIAVFVDVHNTLVIGAINKWGTDLQKQHYLPKLATNVVGAFSLTEHHAGSDAYSLSCEARKHGDGYIISGKKHWTTNAREAGLFILLANVIEDSCSYLTAFIIDDTKSLRILPSSDKMGIIASDWLVLNSVSNVEKALKVLGVYRRIECYLDNDDAGRRTLEKLRADFGEKVIDRSSLYANHKDLNEFLLSKNAGNNV